MDNGCASVGQLARTYLWHFVQTQDVAWKTCRKRWMIETDGERELGKSVWVAWHDDDDDDGDISPATSVWIAFLSLK